MTSLLKLLVIGYRISFARWFGGNCRFHPTCSQYALDALDKYGPWHGSIKTIRRISRCHPLGGKGFDPA